MFGSGRSPLQMLGLGFLLGGLFSAPAYAYLDPGTGSLALQAIIAAFVGMLVALKLYWTRFKAFCAGLFRKSSRQSEPPAASPPPTATDR